LETKLSERTVAPYGTWSSPITAEMIAHGDTFLSAPRLVGGTAWWLEGRPREDGRVVLVRADLGSSPVDATPAPFNVRTLAHEYGGGAYCLHGRTVYFSNFDDQRLYRLEPAAGAPPVPITPAVEGRRHRYADGCVTADGSLWVGVRERHAESGKTEDVVNELVAVPTDGSTEPRVIAGGRDFYAAPRISPRGDQLSFLAWDLPWMPWDGCELHVGGLGEDGTLTAVTRVAGRDGEESIWQPEWSPAGDLVFASDRSGWWNLERLRGPSRSVLYEAEAEFGYPAWTFAGSSFGFLEDGRIVCAYDQGGLTSFAVLDPEAKTLSDLDLPYNALRSGPHVAAEGGTALLIAGSATMPVQVARLDLDANSLDVLRTGAEVPVDEAYVSAPRLLEFPTDGGVTAYALYYPPKNPRYVAEDEERPPLIVLSHGGPTSNATPIFALGIQFWTSRGFAVVSVNYGGSSGHGRSFRKRLDGAWGVVDLHDCVNAARYLADQGEVDPGRLLIRGGSAGGYTTICALTFTDAFAGGTSYFGVADLEPFAMGDTHKFESKYEETLIGPYPAAAEVYRARSPIHFVDRIRTPMLVLQGADDKVVPPSQAELIVGALRAREIPHAYLLFEGEGHGFRKAESTVTAFEAELSFYLQILGLEPGDPLPPLEIEHLR
jgi:dienelactone hydrolase